MSLAIPFALLVVLPLVEAGPPGAPDAVASTASSIDLDDLIEQARAVQDADMRSWAGYRFRRIESRQKVDGSGEVIREQRKESVVTPIPGGFDERLVTIDGRPPTDKEIAGHRAEGLFARRYARMIRGDGEPEHGGYSLGFLLRMSSYQYVGVEDVEGVPTHRIDFGPGVSGDGSLAGRFAETMAGTLWITVDGFHVAKATAHSTSPISVAFIVVKVEDIRLELESGPVGEGRWLPRKIDVRARSRIVGFPSRTRSLYEYLDFVSAPTASGPMVSGP